MSKRNNKKKGKQEITQEQLRALAEAMKDEKGKFPNTAAEAAEYLNRGGKMGGADVAYFMTRLAAPIFATVILATMSTPPLSCCGIDMEYMRIRLETNWNAKTCLER